MIHIEQNLTRYLMNAPQSVQEVLFVANGLSHPIWIDSTEVLGLVKQQFLETIETHHPQEVIFAFVGIKATNPITGDRQCVGFAITNRRIIIQNQQVKSRLKTIDFYQNQNPEQVCAKAWGIFNIQNTLSFSQANQIAFKGALKAVVAIVLPELQTMEFLDEQPPKSNKIDLRIKELRLNEFIRSLEDDERRILKFAEKHQIQDPLYTMLDKPLFGSTHGIVITKNGVTCRDTSENVFSVSWQDIKQNLAYLDDKKDIIYVGQTQLILPSSKAEAASAVVSLLNEVAWNEVSI